jgi:hypothetical protein
MLEEMQIRNFAENTQESYLMQVSLFARYFRRSPEGLGPVDIRTYQVYLTNEKKRELPASVHDEQRGGLIVLRPHSFRVTGATHGESRDRYEDGAAGIIAAA